MYPSLAGRRKVTKSEAGTSTIPVQLARAARDASVAGTGTGYGALALVAGRPELPHKLS